MTMGKRVFTTEEYIDKTYAKGNRGDTGYTTAPETPEEYIERLSTGDAEAAMAVGSVEGLGLGPEELMWNKPLWLGDAPEITDIAYEDSADTVVIGCGPSGTTTVLRLAEMGADVLCLEAQTWAEYDAYACDMATYNSKFFTSLGVPEYDTMKIFNEFIRKGLGMIQPKLMRDYATRSGEMFDWMMAQIPQEYIDAYAHPAQYEGHKYFGEESLGQYSFIGMTQWRDTDTNNNMWPFVMRSLHKAAQAKGARFRFGSQAIRLLQDENGAVTGIIARDMDNKYFKVNCKVVVMATGDYGGNPDMRLDLNDTVRNLAWSMGLDRTSPDSFHGGGRDGSGIRMCMWAGGKMEPGPRAGQDASINLRPKPAIGGIWPTFGPDGRRFFNESATKFGPTTATNMIGPGKIVSCAFDSHWDEHLEHQGYGHEMMDRSNKHMMSVVRRDMANYKVGPDGFDVHHFPYYGEVCTKTYAGETLEELGRNMGYTGEALENFLDEIAHYNEMCEAGYDSDWGSDPNYMFPIKDGPFFGTYITTGCFPTPDCGLCQHGGIITDGNYRVTDYKRDPIPGLYAVGNTCGQRFIVQYHTPTSGNCCGYSLTNGYCAAEHIAKELGI